MGGDFYFGAHVQPTTVGAHRLMNPEDDQVCFAIEKLTRGPHDEMHSALEMFERTEDGIWMHSGDRPGQNQQPNIPSAQLEVISSGDILLRFQERERDTFEQYFNSFLTIYAVSKRYFTISACTRWLVST
jgi:hypothetical protein